MRIPSGVTDQYIYFVAVDATDFTTRETGLTGFTVYRSRDGAAAQAMATPTINETDATNMPGVYELLLDEDTTIAAGNDSEEMALHITATGMAPVTRVIELYRPKITAGNTLTVSAGGNANTAVQSIAANAITASAIAANAIGASELAADAATEIATAVWVSGTRSLTAGAITAATFGAGAIDAAALATDAVAEIADAVWDETQASHVGAGTFGEIATEIANIETDTQDIQGRLPAALVGGRMDASVGAVAAGAITSTAFGAGAIDAAALAADAVAEIADGVWDETQASHITAGSFGEIATEIANILADTNELQTDDVPGLIAALNDPTAAAIADAVGAETQAAHVGAGTFGEIATEIAKILADTNELQTDDVPGLIAALNDISVADVLGGTITELASVPAASPTLAQAIALLYMALRNRRDTTATSDEIHNAANTVIGTATLSDDTVTFQKNQYS